MLYSNQKLKSKIESELKRLVEIQSLNLTVISYKPTLASQKYISLKSKKAAELNIKFTHLDLETKLLRKEVKENPDKEKTDILISSGADTTDLDFEQKYNRAESLERFKEAKNILAEIKHPYIIQLPIETRLQNLTSFIPKTQDVDLLNSENFEKLTKENILPPTLQSIFWILADMLSLDLDINFSLEDIDLKGKTVLIIGQGVLVGKPLVNLIIKTKAAVISVNEWSLNLPHLVKLADIIISAAGKPALLNTSLEFKVGAIVIDAATAEDSGKLVGDAEPEIAEKVYLCPSPGGVGPLTILALFLNLYKLKTLE